MDNTLTQDILAQILPVVEIILLALVTWGVARLSVWLHKKWGIDINDRQQKALRETAAQAIAYAEEKAAHALDVDIDAQSAASGKAKALMALEFAQRVWPKLDETTIDDAIHAELALTVGTGATKHQSYALTKPIR